MLRDTERMSQASSLEATFLDAVLILMTLDVGLGVLINILGCLQQPLVPFQV